MKAKQMLSILTLLAICLFTNAQEKLHCLDNNCGFEAGQIVYLFGDQVQLREAPSTESKVLKTLPIGMHMIVQEKHEHSWRYKGMDHHFYKVDYKGTEGYVLGGLLALEKKTINSVVHLFGRAKMGDEDYLLIRSLQEDGSFEEKKTRLANTNFQLTQLGNKGLKGVQGILFVDYIANAYDVEGGGIYLFQQENTLHQVARVSQRADGSAYYFKEQLIFPEDTNGLDNKIRYKKEIGKNFDGISRWLEKSLETKEMVLTDTRLKLVQQ